MGRKKAERIESFCGGEKEISPSIDEHDEKGIRPSISRMIIISW